MGVKPRHPQGAEDQILKLQTYGYPRMATDCWGRLRGSLQQTSSRFSSWAPSCFSLANRVGGEWQRRFRCENARTRARKAKAAKSAALMGYSRARYRFKKCPVITRRLFPKPQHATWSSGSYFQNTGAPPHHSAIILKVARAACYHSALPPKRRFRVQSLGISSKMLTSLSTHSAWPLKR